MFVVGTVYSQAGVAVDCLRGAKVEIHSTGSERFLGSAVSDAFGAFMIDGLRRSEEVEVLVSLPDGRVIGRRAPLTESIHLGILYVESETCKWKPAAPQV